MVRADSRADRLVTPEDTRRGRRRSRRCNTAYACGTSAWQFSQPLEKQPLPTGAGEPVQLSILRATGTLFDVLDTPVTMGRALTPDDEQPGRPAVAVISQRLWHQRLSSDPNVIGRSLTLGGRPYAIIGILPRGFELPEFDPLSGAGSLTARVDAIVPLRPNPEHRLDGAVQLSRGRALAAWRHPRPGPR
jgi:hypothetical protein